MRKQKEEEEKGAGRRTRMCPGALLLGATALSSEKEPDAEEGSRKRGVQVAHAGL